MDQQEKFKKYPFFKTKIEWNEFFENLRVQGISLIDNLYQVELTRSEILKKKNHVFKFDLLETTQYNYKELSKLYKEQAQMGYNKTLPQVALGQSQSSVLATINFENDVLHLAESMIPPMMSSTMNSNVLKGQQGSTGGQS